MKNMRKIFAWLLLLAMMAALPLHAFAQESTVTGNTSGTGSGGIDINASIVGADNNPIPTSKISIELSWEEMKFTYTEGDRGVWNAATHRYDGVQDGTWSDNKPKIELKNHSNTTIDASFSFSSSAGFGGKFYNASVNQQGQTVYTAITGTPTLSLDTADGYAVATPPTAALHFGLDTAGVSLSESKSLGTVTVAVSATAKICGAASLQQALNAYEGASGTVTLDSDVDLRTMAVPMSTNFLLGTLQEPLVIDLGGHTVYGLFRFFESNVVLKNGTIQYSIDDYRQLSAEAQNEIGSAASGVVRVEYDGDLTLEDITIDSEGMIALYNASSVVQTAGTFKVLDGYDDLASEKTIGIYGYECGFIFSGTVEVDSWTEIENYDPYYEAFIQLTAGEGNSYKFYGTTVTMGDTDQTYYSDGDSDELPLGILNNNS